MSRRDQIQMSDAEVLRFLGEERTMICATHGPRGYPHLMPLWYVVRSGTLWAWTFAKSQKAVNLRRDPRATVQVEAGEEYQELRGVMLETDVTVHDDVETVLSLGIEVFRRYTPGIELSPDVEAMVRKQAEKRIAMEFVERKRSTWDHRKLAQGVY